MSWSHSSLKTYKNCARQWYETRILKKWPKEDTEATLYGNALHLATEVYVKKIADMHPGFEFMKPIVDALTSKEGTIYAELQMAVTIDLQPCEWKAKEAWCRGIADLLIIDDEMAWCVDWKTGSTRYADKDQLDLMSLLVFIHFPQVQQVNSALAFVLKNAFVKHKRTRLEAKTLWWKYKEDVAQMENDTFWAPKQTGLCRKHCPVLSCEFNGRS